MAKSKSAIGSFFKFNQKIFREVFIRVQIILWSFILLVALFFVGVNYGLLGTMPDLVAIQNPNNAVSTTIYSADYETLGSYYNENRIEVSYDELSPYLVNALVATEDKRFYDHSGIDGFSMTRAFLYLGSKGGASTITMQTAKNLFTENWSTKNFLLRSIQKLKEGIIAIKLERRNLVLNRMVTMGYLPEAQAETLKRKPIELSYRKLDENNGFGPYFRMILGEDMKKWCKEHKKSNGDAYNLYRDGLKIYTTISPRMQQYAEEAVAQHMTYMQKLLNAQENIKKGTVWNLLHKKEQNLVKKAKN